VNERFDGLPGPRPRAVSLWRGCAYGAAMPRQGATVQSSVPVAPWYSAVIAVTPTLTPTTTPSGFTVAVCEFAVDHVATAVMVSLVPFGSVATADIWTESVRPTAQGDGESSIAEIVDDEVVVPVPLQAAPASSTRPRAKDFSGMFMGASSCRELPARKGSRGSCPVSGPKSRKRATRPQVFSRRAQNCLNEGCARRAKPWSIGVRMNLLLRSARGLILPAFACALVACPDGPASSAPADAASANPPPTTPRAPPEQAAAPPSPHDADLAGLQKLLRCAAGGAVGPCRVLAAMTTCGAWNPVSPAGEGRYIGRGWVVQDGVPGEEVAVMRVKTVPKTDVAAWQLPVTVAIADLPRDAGLATTQAERAVSAFERYDVPPPKNATMVYMKERADWPAGARAVRTSGTMVQTSSDQPAYLCQGPHHDVLLVQQPRAAEGKTADGVYAQLWPATW